MEQGVKWREASRAGVHALVRLLSGHPEPTRFGHAAMGATAALTLRLSLLWATTGHAPLGASE
jgi:hypothetical protein